MKRLIAALVIVLTLGAPAIAHADQGPGYGGDADSLDVSWKETKDKAMAAGPPPVPSGESGSSDLPDPERMAMSPDSSSLRVDGIGFRGNDDLRPILLYEGFEGHPLRKDYPKHAEQPLVPYRDEAKP